MPATTKLALAPTKVPLPPRQAPKAKDHQIGFRSEKVDPISCTKGIIVATNGILSTNAEKNALAQRTIIAVTVILPAVAANNFPAAQLITPTCSSPPTKVNKPIKKKIVVHTNDEKHPKLNFVIWGKVDKFVTITPNNVILRGYVGEHIKQSIKMIPEKKYPFKILGVKAQKGKDINYKIEKIITPSKVLEYLLTVTNLKNEKGRFFDIIYLETDSKIRPEIKISVYGNITDRN